MERIGIIDLGSNSVRLVIINIEDNGSYYQKENLKETVRLIGGRDKAGCLSEESMNYAVETIRLFVSFCKARHVGHIIAVATAATRVACNQKIFIEKIRRETGLKFKVLSGKEEAHYGYIGTVNTMPQTSGLMADLGGGSLKLVSFVDRIEEKSGHLPFGSVSLTNEYNIIDKPQAQDLAKLEAYLLESYQTLPWIQGTQPVIGVGGTFRSLARVVRKSKDYVPDITDAYELTLADVTETYERLSLITLEERLNVPGLEHARADIIVAGVLAIKCLLEVSNRNKIIVSTTSIRDGLLYEYLHRYTADPIVLSVITHHIDNLIQYYGLEENHLRRVSNLAVTLFDQLSSLHGLNGFERRVLLIASLLHEIGAVIGMESRDKHTLYMLLNAPIHGLTHRERVMAAYVAASHDQLFMTGFDEYITHGPLEAADRKLVNQLAAILQITHSLDRCQAGVVTQVRGTMADGKCTLGVRTKAGAGADLEIKDAMRRADNFEAAFGVPLNVIRLT